MAAKWILRIVGACGMVGVVHAFMIFYSIPRPAAWYLGAIIYAGLIAVLFSDKPLFEKLGIYFVFVVVAIVGAMTVCPCTHAHFIVAPAAGLVALGLVHGIKRLFTQSRHSKADHQGVSK